MPRNLWWRDHAVKLSVGFWVVPYRQASLYVIAIISGIWLVVEYPYIHSRLSSMARLLEYNTLLLPDCWIEHLTMYIITSPPIGGGRGIVMPMSVCLLLCESPKGVFAKYIGQYRLLLCESQRLFAKYIGQYRLCVCYFAKARRAFSQSILVSTVCYFAKARRAFSQSILVSTVCVSVCLFVCLFVCHASYRPQFCTDQDYFFYRRFGIPS